MEVDPLHGVAQLLEDAVWVVEHAEGPQRGEASSRDAPCEDVVGGVDARCVACDVPM